MAKLLLKTMLLLCTLIAGSGTIWGQSTTYTTGSSISWSHSNGVVIGGTTYNACKIAKGSNTIITIPAGTTKLFVHCAAWNGESHNLSVSSTTTGVSITPTSWSITADSNISGNSTNFTLNSQSSASTTYYKEFSVSGASSTSVVKFQCASNKRAVIWGINAEIGITSIAFSAPKTTDVGVGGTVALTPTVLPATYTEAIDWESDDTDIATVSNSGVVTGIAEGTAHITAKAHGNPSTIYDVCTVTVTAAVPVTGISLKPSTTLYLGGDTETLAPTISPNDATNKNVTWKSSDATTVSVSDEGVITALKLTNGTPVTITATTEDRSFSASCAVTVSPIAVTEVTLNKTSIRLLKDATETLTATVAPANATNKTISWTSSNEDVATVTSAGVVTAKAIGTATITVTTEDGSKTATCTVKVTDGSIDLTESGTITFNTFSQDLLGSSYASSTRNCNLTASDGNVYTWKEVNGIYQSGGWQLKASTGVATSPSIKSDYGFTISTTKKTNNVIISDGTNSGQNSLTTTKTNATITIMGDGTYAVFTAITITPLKPTRSVTFPDGDQEITVDGSTITKTATVSPTGTVTYSSSNTAVATVNSTTGEVTAVKGGSAVITATVAADDDYRESTGSYTVTVNKAATTLAFTNDEETVELVDGTATFTATATPADGSRTITYSTDDEITVNSSTGAVTYTATGDFTIKANATATDKYLAPSEASYTLHVVDNRVPVVNAAGLSLGLTDVLDAPIALNGMQKDDEGFLAASYTLATGFSGTEVVTYSSSDATVFKIENGNEFTALKGGTATVTVTITSGGNKMFTTVEKEFTVTIINPSKTATEIAVLNANTDPVVDGDVLNLTYGTPIALDVDATSGYDGTISKVLSNSSIVGLTNEGTTVTITPNAVGSTMLTISAAETANYTAAENIVVTINVAGPTASTSTPDGEDYWVYQNTLLSNSIPSEWTKDNSSVWYGQSSYGAVTTTGKTSGTYDLYTDVDAIGYKNIGVTFDHTGNNLSDIESACNVYVKVGSNDPEKLTINNFTSDGNWTYVNSGEIDLGSDYDNTTVRFIFRYTPTSGNNGKWEIKNFKVYGTEIPHADVTIPSSGFGTFCYQYPLDLDLLDEDAKAYIVTSVEGTNVTLKRITGTIKGGVPFILYGSNEEHTLYTAESSSTVPAGNMLVGTLAPIYITATNGDYTNFGMKSGKFVKAANGVMPANKAYLPVLTSSLGGGAREFNFIFDDDTTTGIKSMNNEQLTIDNEAVYDLQGRKVAQPTKGGLYIVNGRKVVIK